MIITTLISKAGCPFSKRFKFFHRVILIHGQSLLIAGYSKPLTVNKEVFTKKLQLALFTIKTDRYTQAKFKSHVACSQVI
ncbi:hypothetical protein GCM10008107_03630 [Psychrosphaera saromensis]|nr:hypothetical protein GCM10008107_03630 [Psychrosphaera saromensis]GLQ14085.1 hypothetical protein GCM10007917_15400 [Psychrosphaera saromensis]